MTTHLYPLARCRYCNGRTQLIAGVWHHDGIAALTHAIKHAKEKRP